MRLIPGKISAVLIILLICTACNFEEDTAKAGLEVKTKIFVDYLKNVFNSKIPRKRHHYFLLPQRSCHYCKYKGLEFIRDSCNNNDFSIITSLYPSQIKEKDISCEKINFDKNPLRLNKLNLWAPSLILCKDRKILSIKELTAKGFIKRLPGPG